MSDYTPNEDQVRDAYVKFAHDDLCLHLDMAREDARRGIAKIKADAHNMFPRALDALNAVLELHQPIDGLAYDSPPQECNVCADDRGPKPWPCATVRALEGVIDR